MSVLVGVVADDLEALWGRFVYESDAVGVFDILSDLSQWAVGARVCLSAIIHPNLDQDIAIIYRMPFFAMSLT